MAAFTEEQVKDFSIRNWYDLSGQVAVVTGGATGLGLAITRCLVSAGAKVAVVASRAPELVADTLAEFGGKAVYYQFNITDTDHAQELADKITAEQGPVSILVNNAGNHCKKFIWDMTVDDYKRVLDVHLVGAFALTKAFVPQMKEQGHGRIIFQASMTSYIGQPQVAGYSTAKAGYLGLIHTLTAELAEYRQRHCSGLDRHPHVPQSYRQRPAASGQDHGPHPRQKRGRPYGCRHVCSVPVQ